MSLDDILARPGETLIQHTLAVVDRINRLAVLHPLPEYPRLYDNLRLAAWLHDSGKLAHGFQAQLRSRGIRWGLRHEVLSLAFMRWLSLNEADYLRIVAAIAFHHKDHLLILDRYRPHTGLEDRLIADVDETAVRAWYDWLAQNNLPLAHYQPLQPADIRAALDALSVWVDHFADGLATPDEIHEAVLLRGLLVQADHAAAANVTPMPVVTIHKEILPAEDKCYPHQKDVITCAGQSVLLVAPTGAGKTEAALLWAQATHPPRLIYMLPYRVSMNVMLNRLETGVAGVGVQHGRALLSLYRRLSDDGRNALSAEAEARHRLALARLHAYAARIFSPYRLLRTVYRFKGYEADLVDYQDACIVVDEIHAYEPGRLALILGALAFVKAHFNAHILLMTATLPRLVRQAIEATVGELPQVSADDKTYRAFRRHRVYMQAGDLLNQLDLPVQRARNGEAVLIVCNTVRRARTVSAMLMEQGIVTLTLHGRFAYRDRWQREKDLLAYYGPDGQRPDQPMIVVATQVIEVSLDVDFDALFTDPAPLDALVQRFGRVNRRRRLDMAPVTIFEQPRGADERFSIYDPVLVQASVDLLRGQHGRAIDEARVGGWLDQVYGAASGWQADFDAARVHFEQWVLADFVPFESAGQDLRRLFNRLMDECLVLPLDLEDEYEQLLDTRPIEADELLVSISWGQYAMLERAGRAWRGEGDNEGLFYVDAPYDPDVGLVLGEDGG